MKRLLIITFSILLLIACQKLENILVVNPGATDDYGADNLPIVTSIIPGNGQELVDQDTVQAGIQGEIEVTFSNFMEISSITEDNIVILSTTTGNQIPSADITTDYVSTDRKLYIYIDNVPDSNAFLLRLVSGIDGMVNNYNKPLDWDQDNFADGSPYDDYHSTCYTATNADLINLNQPEIADFTPDTIRTSNQLQRIIIDFDMNMDTTTLNTSNITLEKEGGGTQTLTIISRSLTSITLEPASQLDMAENYVITVECANIDRTTANTYTPNYIAALDGNEDGPEQSEPDLQSYFRVDTYIPPTASVSAITNGGTFTFSQLMDASTLTKGNVRIRDNIGYIPPEDFRIYTDSANTYTMLDYTFLRSVSGGTRAFVSKDVQDENSYGLDGNGNEIGGEPWDDYYQSF